MSSQLIYDVKYLTSYIWVYVKSCNIYLLFVCISRRFRTSCSAGLARHFLKLIVFHSNRVGIFSLRDYMAGAGLKFSTWSGIPHLFLWYATLLSTIPYCFCIFRQGNPSHGCRYVSWWHCRWFLCSSFRRSRSSYWLAVLRTWRFLWDIPLPKDSCSGIGPAGSCTLPFQLLLFPRVFSCYANWWPRPYLPCIHSLLWMCFD